MNINDAQSVELIDLPKSELINIIFTLRDTIATLQIQVTELKAKGKSSDDQSPLPAQQHPSWVKANKKTDTRKQEKRVLKTMPVHEVNPRKKFFTLLTSVRIVAEPWGLVISDISGKS